MAGRHHRLDGHEFEQAPAVGGGQGRPGVLQSMGSHSAGHDLATDRMQYKFTCLHTHTIIYYELIYLYNSLLQYSCLENPHGQGAYCSPTRGVAKSGTTERLSTARNYNMCESVSHPWPPKGL